MSDTAIPEWKLKVYGRAISGEGKRRKPSTAQTEAIRLKQGNRCLYCDLKIGTVVWRGDKYQVKLRTHWDHFIPYVYSQANPADNWVLACNICNLIKGCKMFRSVVEAQEYIRERWITKGYQLPTSITDGGDPVPEPPPIPEPESEPEPSYEPVPLHLAKAALVVCRRLANEAKSVSMSRIVVLGGSEATLREAVEALLASGHVKRQLCGNTYIYWLVRPYRLPPEAENLPDLSWSRGGINARKLRSKFPGRE